MVTNSIRWRLTLWHAGVIALVTVVYACGVFQLVRAHLSADLDRQLLRNLDIAVHVAEVKNSGDFVKEENGELIIQEKENTDSGPAGLGRDDFIEIRTPDSRLAMQFPAAGPHHPRDMRYQSRASRIAGREVTVRAGVSERQMKKFLDEILWVLALGIPAALALSVLGGWWLAGRTLAPLAQMADRARRISAENLAERLPPGNPSDELGRLAAVFNDAFSRLEQSFEQLRRFTADASHELRTPLTALRTAGEIALREARSPAQYRETIGSMLEETSRLTRLVDSLLFLARADQHKLMPNLQPADAAELVRAAVETLGVLAEEKGQRIQVDAQQAVPVLADSALLRQALLNLLDNAIKYSPAGSIIRVRAGRHDAEAVLEVADSGPGIAPEHRPHVFERFYRVDKARTRDIGGAGLGLAITRWIVTAHHGRIELTEAEGGCCRFRITLPAA